MIIYCQKCFSSKYDFSQTVANETNFLICVIENWWNRIFSCVVGQRTSDVNHPNLLTCFIYKFFESLHMIQVIRFSVDFCKIFKTFLLDFHYGINNYFHNGFLKKMNYQNPQMRDTFWFGWFKNCQNSQKIVFFRV